MPRPIVVIHKGNPDYLKFVLLKAREFNPLSPILLLGNEDNACLTEVVPKLEHETICINGDAKKLEETYHHRSELSYGFELFCFQRWILLRDAMKQRGWDRCLHLDSDVLLFSDISESGKRFDPFVMTLTDWCNQWHRMGHTNFINGMDVMNEFCDFLLELFSSKECAEQLDYIAANSEYPNISDMTALGLFRLKSPQRFADFSEIVDNEAFDVSCHTISGGYKPMFLHRLLKKKQKDFQFRNGIPYCRNLEKSIDVRFHSIHFHGPTKYLIKYYYPGKPIRIFGKMLLERWLVKIKAELFRSSR